MKNCLTVIKLNCAKGSFVDSKKFKEILKEKFPSNKIITLEEMVGHIGGTSKVRVGQERKFQDYAEISFKHINYKDLFYIPEDYKTPPPANRQVVTKQQLYINDILLPRRFSIGKVGIISQELLNKYPTVVGHNNMIRIQFQENDLQDIPIYVLEYLKLPFVREYIDSQIKMIDEKEEPRTPNLLRASIIKELPIPEFKEHNGEYKDYVYSYLNTQNQLLKLHNKLDTLLEQFHVRNINNSDTDIDIICFPKELDKFNTHKQKIHEINQFFS